MSKKLKKQIQIEAKRESLEQERSILINLMKEIDNLVNVKNDQIEVLGEE